MLPKKISAKKLAEIRQSAKASWRLLIMVWKIDPKLFSISFVSVIIPGVVPFVNIYIYKLVIDLVIRTVNGTPLNYTEFFALIGLRIFTYFLQDLAFRTQSFINRILWTKVPIYLNEIIFRKIANLDIHYFENDKFRNQLEKAREAYEYRPQQLFQGLFFGSQSVVQVAIAFVAIVHLNWFFIILILAVSVPEFIVQTFQSKASYGIWDAEASLRKRFHYLSGILQHDKDVKEIKIFSLGDRFLRQVGDLQQTFFQNNRKISNQNYLTGILFNAISSVVFIGIELYVILEAIAKRVSVGDIAFYTGVVSNFQNGLAGLFRNANTVFENSLYIQSIFDIIDVEPIIKEKENPVKLTLKSPPSIEFKDVTFAYPETKVKILKNFSLTINPGDKIAFVGENGAGKSTIIKLLARFYDVDEGEILINGVNIKDLELKSWYGYMGVLFQDFNRYEYTVKDNIHFGRESENDALEGIIKAATSSGAHSVINKLDKGYDQMLGKMFEEGTELSGGQWQKIALARAFFRNAPILVLDEPTSSIDARAEAEIFSKVEKLSKDKTVLIISHRFSTVRNADKIYVIDGGKIIESGSHKELMKVNGQYAELFNLQAKGYL